MSYRKLPLALPCVLLLAPLAWSAEKQINPRIELGFTADDNYRLDLPGSEVDVAGALLQAQVQFRTLTPRSEFTLTPRLRASWFPDQPQEDSNDYFLNLEHLHSTQRSRTRLPLRFSDETVVLSELPGNDFSGGGPDPDLGETGGADAGRVSVRNRRQLIEFMPRFEHDFTQRRRLELAARYLNVGFDEDVPGEQIGYQEMEASAGLTFLRSERTSLTVRVLANGFSPEVGVNDALGYGAQLQWSKQLSELSSLYFRVGAQQTEIDIIAGGLPDKRRTTDYLAGMGGRRHGQHFDLLLDLTRGVGPTASGFVVARDQLRLRLLHPFSERLNLFVALRAIRDEAIDEAAPYPRRLYANGNAGIEWRLRRNVSIAASYDHTWQEFADELDPRGSSGVLLSLIYEPNRGR